MKNTKVGSTTDIGAARWIADQLYLAKNAVRARPERALHAIRQAYNLLDAREVKPEDKALFGLLKGMVDGEVPLDSENVTKAYDLSYARMGDLEKRLYTPNRESA